MNLSMHLYLLAGSLSCATYVELFAEVLLGIHFVVTNPGRISDW